MASRAKRWAGACAKAAQALDAAAAALAELREVQEEYEGWRDNMPEGLQGSPTGEKLEAVCDLDIEGQVSAVEEAKGVVEEAEATDLPLGWGKD